MKAVANKHKKSRSTVPCPYKRQVESSHPKVPNKTQHFRYNQACTILQAVELNRGKRLDKKCIAHLALFVSQAWEGNPCQVKVQQLYYMMNNLLDTTGMGAAQPFETLLETFCKSPVSMPMICPSVTLLIAISYVERLNSRYRDLKGTAGCGSRLIMVAFIMASKYIHDCLRLIIYTNNRNSMSTRNSIINTVAPITPPTSPKMDVTASASAIQSMASAIKNNQEAPTNKTSPSDSNDGCIDNNICIDKNAITVHDSSNFTAATTATTTCDLTSEYDRTLRIARMEKEFLYFLNYDLSVQDPSTLVTWANSYDIPETTNESESKYITGDEADDEMEEEEDDA